MIAGVFAMQRRSLLFSRLARAGLALIGPVAVFALTSCSHQPSPPVTVSQSETDLHLVQRVEAEARNSCSSDDGLRGIQWPYKSLPGGINQYSFVPNTVSASIVAYSIFLANPQIHWGTPDPGEHLNLGPAAPSPHPTIHLTSPTEDELHQYERALTAGGATPTPPPGTLTDDQEDELRRMLDDVTRDPSITDDQLRTAYEMLAASRGLSSPWYVFADLSDASAWSADYICNDGAQLTSKAFKFIP
jgi:hypothetical protein